MDLDIFNKPDPSGKLSKEKYLIKNYKEEYDYIINYCNENQIYDIPFKEKVYLCINNIKSIPTCKNPNCNKNVKFKNLKIGYHGYCSKKCISSDPNIKKLKEENSLKKYNTKTPAQSERIKEKIIKTNIKMYGGNSPMSDQKIKNKSKNTLIKNWSVDNPSKSEDILKKRIDSFKKSNYKETFKQTSLQKYGVEHPWMNKEIHKKTIDHFYKDYKKRIIDKSIGKNIEFVDFLKNDKTMLKFTCAKCQKQFNIPTYQFYYRVNNDLPVCINCYPISENSSLSHISLYNFINNNYNGEIIQNEKNAIQPYEIDIYLPDLKIGFEFNGLYWHSSKFKNKNYHLNKYTLSEEKGITLISIWEDDWNIKRNVCESVILNKIGKSEKIYGRLCNIKNVAYIDSKEFLENNHLQGDCKSSIRIGLYYNNELVSLMTFSKLRLPVGGKIKKEDTWELTRFCNKTNISVIGGASKLFKHFLKIKNPKEIQTYSDNMLSSGLLYEKLGFNYKHTSKPGYWYVINKIRHHRFNYRKSRLIKEGGDPSKYEHEIMEEKGYYRVWSAGNKKWIYSI